MAEWEANPNLDYSATGDDIDTASQKIIAMFTDVYDKLNRVRTFDADASHSVGDASPYSVKIDTSVNPPAILMRKGDNTGYVQIGSVAANLGISASDVGAITGTGMGKLSLGSEDNLPATATTYDLYFAYDTGRLYMYRTGAWRVFLSLQFGDLLGVSDSVIDREEVAANGANKIPRLNSVGQGEFDITGNAAKIAGYNLFVPAVSDGQVLAFNAALQRWEVADNNALTSDDVSTTGEANKIVKTDSDRKIHVDITGNAAKVGNKVIDTNNLQNNDALVYNADSQTWKNKQIPTLNSDGVMEGVNTTGSAAKWAGKSLQASGVEDGQVLAWSESAQAFMPINQGGVGNARNLVLKSNDQIVREYNGSERVVADIVVTSDTEPANAAIWIKPIE